jgi:nucleotide-binding universal stress UspA family protein
MLLGSVTEEVVQRAKQPVLTMLERRRSAHALEPRRILVAVDLSDHSAVALAHAKHIAAAFDAELLVLHVLIQSAVPSFYDGMAAQLVFDSPRFESRARMVLEGMYAEAAGPSGRVSLHVERGLAVERILEFVSRQSIDLAVLASHGLTGLAQVLMGSVSERVVRRSSCPVLTVKSFGKSLLAADPSSAKWCAAAAH